MTGREPFALRSATRSLLVNLGAIRPVKPDVPLVERKASSLASARSQFLGETPLDGKHAQPD